MYIQFSFFQIGKYINTKTNTTNNTDTNSTKNTTDPNNPSN
jgi:hypothetical protein